MRASRSCSRSPASWRPSCSRSRYWSFRSAPLELFVAATVLSELGFAAVATTLVLLFGLSLVLSYLYAWTGNLVVPIIAHGLYDALLFALAYFAIEVQKPPTVLAVG